ncbi:hypothetical protein FB451DRAFT_1378591 [Mycena latifolia]|nr:hypothetical protein FB451DRAFT_1378591 [Mycena latifolia]
MIRSEEHSRNQDRSIAPSPKLRRIKNAHVIVHGWFVLMVAQQDQTSLFLSPHLVPSPPSPEAPFSFKSSWDHWELLRRVCIHHIARFCGLTGFQHRSPTGRRCCIRERAEALLTRVMVYNVLTIQSIAYAHAGPKASFLARAAQRPSSSEHRQLSVHASPYRRRERLGAPTRWSLANRPAELLQVLGTIPRLVRVLCAPSLAHAPLRMLPVRALIQRHQLCRMQNQFLSHPRPHPYPPAHTRSCPI